MAPQYRDLRRQWIRDYEAAAESYGACQFVEVLGSGRVHPKAEEIRGLHDRLCHAREDRRIA